MSNGPVDPLLLSVRLEASVRAWCRNLDTEIALAIWRSSLQLEEVAELAGFLDARTYDASVAAFNSSAVASISYRTTGISPT